MRTAFLFSSVFLLFWGCATHYSKSEKDAVCFYLKNPKAETVFFLYSGDGYRFHEATKTADGKWKIEVPKMSGFAYFYVVDGSTFVPDCHYKESDDFGSHNCIYVPVM